MNLLILKAFNNRENDNKNNKSCNKNNKDNSNHNDLKDVQNDRLEKKKTST